MYPRSFAPRFIPLVLITALLVGSVTKTGNTQSGDSIYLPLVSKGATNSTSEPSQSSLLYRTHITVSTPPQWKDLTKLDVVILSKGDHWATVLVDDLQLEDLARLRYNPEETNALRTLAKSSPALNQWDDLTVQQVDTLLSEEQQLISQLRDRVASDDQQLLQWRITLRQSLQKIAKVAQLAIANTPSVDSDNDGLSDDAEGFWCTNPAKADSDLDGVKDGAEVTALKAWVGNQTFAPPSIGKPFQGWPNPNAGCFDDDRDSIPDVAEGLELGLNPNRESTDLDKFDDGQELFGFTNCPGGDNNCGYGDLPRSADAGFVGAKLPTYVKAPGNHPLVAAFPEPKIEVVESSFHVQTVTTVTTDHTINSGTEKSYSTASTEGTSTAKTDTTTWNEYEEFGTTTALAAIASETDPILHTSGINETYIAPWLLAGLITAGKHAVEKAVDSVYDGIGFVADQACKEVSCQKYVGSAIRATVRTAVDSIGDVRNALANCDKEGVLGQVSCAGKAIGGKWSQTFNDRVKSYDEEAKVGQSGGQVVDYNSNTGQASIQPVYRIEIPQPAFVPTQTHTHGSSHGGSESYAHTTFEQHTITNGEAFSSSESWGNATAVDSAHTADLWFTYNISNTGMEYAREIGNLVFNLYIGDDPNPTYTYFVAADLGGDGAFHNFMPDEKHTYTSRRIPLTLNQMKLIDLAAPIRIVVEDFSYGSDELFYQDAVKGGIMVAIEDGTDDNDEIIDPYLIPTWGNETVLQVLARYFPHETDSNGTITAIWTPEYRSDTPNWCQSPRRPNDVPSKALWCKHELSTAEWWNVYTDGLGNGSEGFQDTPAVAGGVALFRFNQDSDHDGFSDRSEVRLGTDPNDASSLPQPELLAGVHSVRSGNQVTAILSLLNTGNYDAYGIEAVMIAPDNSISIVNNTVGGSGRVRAQQQVIVGSSIKLPSSMPSNWTQANHAVPAVGGYYIGNDDRTYNLTVNCSNPAGCTVGSGTWSIGWNDGKGNNGTLNFGDGYKSPTFLLMGNLGVTVALYTGKVSSGESIAITARTPRDTFQYTINRQPHSEPIVVVSYNDPQGNHRFMVPSAAMALTSPSDNLQQFRGSMLQDAGVEIVTSAPFTPSIPNPLQLWVNNPSGKTLSNAHLFVEAINISGTVVAEIPIAVTLPPGPKATLVEFDVHDFTLAHNPDEDYIVMAFLTDYQGNILDTAGRPLSSFQVDPLPKLTLATETLVWDFGIAYQGTLMKHTIQLANVGHGRLFTYAVPSGGLTLSAMNNLTVGAADTLTYGLVLNTDGLPAGPYSQTMLMLTNDATQPQVVVQVYGTIALAPTHE